MRSILPAWCMRWRRGRWIRDQRTVAGGEDAVGWTPVGPLAEVPCEQAYLLHIRNLI